MSFILIPSGVPTEFALNPFMVPNTNRRKPRMKPRDFISSREILLGLERGMHGFDSRKTKLVAGNIGMHCSCYAISNHTESIGSKFRTAFMFAAYP